MPRLNLKRLVVRTDPISGGTWKVKVPPPDWINNGPEHYLRPPKPNKAQRARARRCRGSTSETPEPTPRMALDEPGRWELKMEVLQAAGYRCVKCKRRHRLTIDHIVPRVIGGGNHRGNLQCLCKYCNKQKGATIWAPETPHRITH